MDVLNEDCLHKIFQYLALKDQIALSLASKRFVCVLSNIWLRKYRKRLELKLSAKTELGVGELKVFIGNVHQHIEHLQLECESVEFINVLRQFQFINTHKLYISVKGAQLLQQEFVAILYNIFPNIKILHAAGKFTGAGFIMWKRLEYLTLTSCFTFQFDYLEDILRELPIHTLILKSFKVELPRLSDNALENSALRVLVLNSYELSYFTPQLNNLKQLKELQVSDLYSTPNLDTLNNQLVELRNTHRIEGISTRDITTIFPKIIDLRLHTHLRHLLLAIDPMAFSEMLPYICLLPTLRILHFHACYVRNEADFQNLFSVSAHLDEISLERCIISYSSNPCLDVNDIVGHRTKPLTFNFYENKSDNDDKAELQLKGQSDLFKLESDQKMLQRYRYLVYEFI
ncbi:PREDICTED: uncharacterized protein LOC108371545 [Rhagoletis zephyria]|uniref:uncharacterized protein LOC108371545 n=1 Tax=Rhagoletis zephyria TaxID=28612 RepID=UPI0008115A0E|nr:PREDICTED: uncharacterized protein LOC108371545 [Rhagoletis zephyria]XP_017482619.1 PREDICTED: uncharacterized protein LOC108371545 [Rhagoletis zephyria]XP_017482620.1 PREDICTED: uncharacterized protein LOC108371545 [Rhagoletis zephyria]XP_017482621.1 PREDICTED: uncharacterized protein LOC108371545 [Rhagoletis zephyria]